MSEQAEREIEPPRRRRRLRGLAVGVAAVLVVAAGLWVARLALAEQAMMALLHAEGIEVAELTVDDLTLSEARLTDVRLGRDGALTAAEVVARYSLGDLLDGRVRHVVVDNLTLAMTVGPSGPSFGSLDRLLFRPAAEPARDSVTRLPVGRLEIRNSYVRATSPYGPLAVAFGAELVGERKGGLNATANLDLAGTSATRLPGTLELAVTPEGDMAGRLRIAGGAFEVGPIEAHALSATASFSGKGGVDALEVDAEVADLRAYDTRFREAKASLALGGNAGSASIRATDAAGKLGLTVEGKGRLDSKTLVARLDATGYGTADAELWRRLGLPRARDAKGSVSLTLSGPRDDLAGDLTIGAAAASLDLDDAALEKPELRLATAVAVRNETLTLTLRPDGALAVAAARLGPVEIAAPVTLPAVPGEAPLLAARLDALDSDDIAVDARLGPAPVRGRIAGTAKTRTPFTATTPAIALRGALSGELAFAGTVEAKGGALALPGHGVAAEGIDASAVIPLARDDGRVASLAIAALRQTADRPVVVPLAVDASVTGAGSNWSITGRIHDASKRLSATLTGQHDPATGAGTVRVAVDDLRFTAEGLQPGTLFPALRGAVESATGTVGLVGSVSWGARDSGATARLLIKELSATVEDIGVQRINTVLDFDSRRARPARQEVAIALVDVGVPLTDGIMAVRIQRDLRLNIDEMTWRLTGGRVYARDVVLDPAARRQSFALNVEGVNLGDLLQMTELEGLSATGTLGGRIPVVLDNGQAVVSGGLLSASGPGVLRYAPDQVPAALQGGGEGVELMLRALTDFRYDALSLSLDRDADGETRIGLHLKGNNPDVYDGYPLEFNLNLSGKLDRILRDTLQGYRVPDTIRRKMLEFGK